RMLFICDWFFGAGALAVFAVVAVDRGVVALFRPTDTVDAYLAAAGWDCRLTVKAHFGPAIAGPFGAPGDKRFDVVGKAVNTAASLDGNGITLSVAAFRKLEPEMRRRFKRHTPPVSYIRNEDPRRSR
ncbi:MAG: hypothetical protein ACHQAY_26195, partial [Hyphomicrobiales bacterium]